MASNDQWNSAVIKTIRDHALSHYNEDGWDFVVETFSDQDILDHCHGFGTLDSCITTVGNFVKLLNERRNGIINA